MMFVGQLEEKIRAYHRRTEQAWVRVMGLAAYVEALVSLLHRRKTAKTLSSALLRLGHSGRDVPAASPRGQEVRGAGVMTCGAAPCLALAFVRRVHLARAAAAPEPLCVSRDMSQDMSHVSGHVPSRDSPYNCFLDSGSCLGL